MALERCDIDDDTYITDLISDDDIPSLIKYLNNPAVTVNTLRVAIPYTRADGEAYIRKLQKESMDSTRIFHIRLNATNELIGACGFYRCSYNGRRTDISYWLGEPYWNRGLIPKVTKKCIEIIQDQWKDLVRIEARMLSWNKSSMRVAEKCGFTFEGILRKYEYKDGQDVDAHVYALIIR